MKQQLMLSHEQFANWLVALRSGEYTQGTKKLRTGNKEVGTYSHCCLGVLCEVSKFKVNVDGYYFDEVTGCKSMHLFPTADVDTRRPTVIVTSNKQVEQVEFVKMTKARTGFDISSKPLSAINDSGKFTFIDIADIIEMFFEPSRL
jgi:hypothetical protein